MAKAIPRPWTCCVILASAGLLFAGFADDEGTTPGRWKALKDQLGDRLHQWPQGCTEQHVIGAVPDDKLQDLFRVGDGELDGDRLRTLWRIGSGSKTSSLPPSGRHLPRPGRRGARSSSTRQQAARPGRRKALRKVGKATPAIGTSRKPVVVNGKNGGTRRLERDPTATASIDQRNPGCGGSACTCQTDRSVMRRSPNS